MYTVKFECDLIGDHKASITNLCEIDTIKFIDKSTGELLLESTTGDKYHQLLLEVGLNAILEKFLNEKNKT